jgi:hypothetical protein
MKRASAESRLLDSPRSHSVVIVGKCRICGCTDENPCTAEWVGDAIDAPRCAWVDREHTLCDSIHCLARVPLRELEEMVPCSAAF